MQVEPPPFRFSSAAIASQQLYPGEALKATYWSDPFEYEPPSYLEASLLKGFQPLNANLAAPKGTLTAPARILIPAIGVDSEVEGLQIMNLGDSRAYETPNHVVGHIPEPSNPGEQGSGWFFGHLESPLGGEGNVFYNLPKVPRLLRKGEEVYTIVEAGRTSYLYRMVETEVVHQNDMKQFDAGVAQISTWWSVFLAWSTTTASLLQGSLWVYATDRFLRSLAMMRVPASFQAQGLGHRYCEASVMLRGDQKVAPYSLPSRPV